MTDATLAKEAPSKRQLDYERARRAIHHFYRIKPNLEAFARVFTKNPKMRVEPTSGASATDGKGTIWLKVNIELGDEYRHDRSVCNERDVRLQLKCQACLARENILVSLFHEIAHNVYESFEAMSDDDKESAVEEALAEADRFGIRGRRLDAIRDAMTQRPPATYAEAASRISPFLFPLINGLEDARINALTMRARPGMKAMFEARNHRIFEHGIETDDGRTIHWREQPGNAQVAVAMSCFGSGQYEEDWFSEDVAEALRDEELQALVLSAVRTDSAAEVYRHGFPILEKLREHGFCRTPEDEPEPIEEGDDAEPDDEDTGGDHDESDEGDGSGPSDADAEPSDEPDDADGSGGGQSEPSDDPDPDADAQDAQGGQDGADEPEPDDGADESDADAQGGQDGADEPEPDDGADEPDAQGGSDFGDEEEWGDDGPEASDGQGGGAEAQDGPGDDEQEVEDGGADGGSDLPEQEGTPDEVSQALASLCGHGEHEDDQREDKDIDTALRQERDFDEPSTTVSGCKVIEFGDTADDGSTAFKPRNSWTLTPMSERVIQQSLGKMRVAFSENRKGSKQRNLKSGKVNGKVLGRRVPVEDVRLFQKRTRPGRRDYFVVLGLDVSYSTVSGDIRHIKSAGYAQAELLSRIGVPFEVWAHSASLTSLPGTTDYGRMVSCDMYVVKRVNERWDHTTKERLEALKPCQANLDGHTMEFYRKRLDSQKATDKVLMYYTDGEMPAENYNEELAVLKRELRECKLRGYEVVGVGVGTDSPRKHGMDTVRIDGVDDVPLVVKELHKRLTR